MDLQDFEQTILKLAFETEARITAASVAYYLGIPSREANRMLNELLKEGVLELDSDAEGNLYYRVPNQGEIADAFRSLRPADFEDLEPAAEMVESIESVDDLRITDDIPLNVRLTRASDDSADEVDVAPFSPRMYSAEIQPSAQLDGALTVREQAPARSQRVTSPVAASDPAMFAHATVRRDQAKTRERGTHSGIHDVLGSVTVRPAETDASVATCGSSTMIVSTTARCEPKPLPEQRPVIISCNEPVYRRSGEESEVVSTTGYAISPWSEPVHAEPSTALAIPQYADVPMRTDLEQPEHQPGMALLLSLILCGTGQIYNGEVSKGIMMMVLCFLLWFVLLGWVVHIWSIVDAVVVAERLNRKP